MTPETWVLLVGSCGWGLVLGAAVGLVLTLMVYGEARPDGSAPKTAKLCVLAVALVAAAGLTLGIGGCSVNAGMRGRLK